ncbi:MAG: LysR family transcriptional regulator [Lachnospiraceae bacterium]|nr:LysR family transcriptional regulator [Lachnospiraceae bacterium]
MNTKQLQYVQVLAREASFSRAAEALGISQPSLSQYVKKIEKEIGMPLFDRSATELRLTEAGRLYVAAGEKIMALERQLEADLSDLAQAKTGELVIGTAPFRAAYFMPLVVRHFQELYPGIRLVVKEGSSAELLEGVERGEYDLCLTVCPPDSPVYFQETVMYEELILAYPAIWPSLGGRTQERDGMPEAELSAINGKAFVMLTDTQLMQRALMQLCRERGISVQKATVVKRLEAQIAMVKAGIGMALVPEDIKSLCHPGEVVFYRLPRPRPTREVVVLWRRDRKLSGAAIDLKRLMRQIATETSGKGERK